MCLGSQTKTMSELGKNHSPACPPRSPFLCVTGLWVTQWRVGTLRFGLASVVSSQDKNRRSHPKCLELDLPQPRAGGAWKALFEACPPSPGPGSERMGKNRASAPGNLWSDKGDKAYNYERLCDSL